MELHCDAAIVGAGAAGLAAARILSRAGMSSVILEARDRIGGRVHTLEDPGLPVPVELGGEFIHGTAGVSFDLLRAARTVAVDTAAGAFIFEDGALGERDDPFEAVAAVMARARELNDDVSVEEFLRTLPDGAASDRARRYARMMVEGFDAADPHRASAIALGDEWGGGETGQTAEQFRPLGGYAPLLRTLLGALDPALVHLRLGTRVHAVRRDGAGAIVDARTATGAPLSVRARSTIVTLPIGVLAGDAVRFDPPFPKRKRDALSRIVMGPVVKIVLRFRTAFWERIAGERFIDGAFFQRPEAAFPTFWTMLPFRAPLLVGWAGGPKADALAGRDEEALTAIALDDLRVLFGSDADPEAELEAAYTHDWQHDEFSRGAYSYVAVGGKDARAELAAPIDGVVFFAGEATASASEAGTVAGALQSGERAANEVLAALRR